MKDSFILKYLDSLSIANKLKKLLFEIIKINEEKGYNIYSERNLILLSSFRFLGKSYCQSEELNDNTIDCSTLVSQSYWEGSYITVPFIADSQRTSQNSIVVESVLLQMELDKLNH